MSPEATDRQNPNEPMGTQLPGQEGQRSIARSLTVAIIAVVVFVTSLTVVTISIGSAKRARMELANRADEYAYSLATSLETRLWNLDTESIRDTGNAYLHNDLVELLRIRDHRGRVLFEWVKKGKAPLIVRTREVTHDHLALGTVEIGLTSRHAIEANRTLWLSGLSAIFGNAIVLVMATGFLLRHFLKKPLAQLNERVAAYAAGQYDRCGPRTSVSEFLPLVDVMDSMAGTISAQVDELKRAELNYRGIFENAAEGIFQTTPEGRFISANPSLARILGYASPQELIQAFSDISRRLYVDPEQRKAYVLMLETDGGVRGFETQLFRKDGSSIWVSANSRGVRDSEGRLAMIEGFLEDITERKRQQADLSAAHESLRSAHADLELRVQERTHELDEINSRLLREVGDRKCAEREVAQRNRELEAANTELRNAQIRLLQAQKLESIGQLASGIAHEINTPIQFIGDNTRFFGESVETLSNALSRYDAILEAAAKGDLPSLQEITDLRKETDLDYLLSELPQGVKDTQDGLRRVSSIVSALKEFSHPDSREKVHTDLNAALQNTAVVCRSEWKYVAELSMDLDSRLPLVPCLPGDMNQVFMNLIVNAAHAIQERIGSSEEKGLIRVSTRLEGDLVCIRIADTGVGIKSGDLHRIFDPFFTTKEIGRGTGQGLAISRNIVVDKHGGRIEVESEVGQGSTFTLHLPVGLP